MKKLWKSPFKRAAAVLLSLALMASPMADFGSMSTVQAEETTITITESKGYAEGAYVEWAPVSGADGYLAYVSQDQSTWTPLDDELIRNYGTYLRAEALGLTAGTWYIKIEAGTFDSAKNQTGTLATTVQAVTVTAHDRSGYAWVNGTASGAYNEDGSLKSDANVIYLTDANKDSVELEVAGTTYTGIQDILNGYKKGKETKPLCVRMIGNVTLPASNSLTSDYKGDIVIEKANNAVGLTFEGVGEDAVANGWGIRIKNSSNVELRNIGFMNCESGEGDNVGLQQGNDHVWVHHCDMFYGKAGSDADQVKGDGALDTKKSTYVTHSYNHFWDNGKCNLQGANASDTSNYITYHHNWYDHSDSRHPRVRIATVHVYNNYYDGNSKYGVGATLDSDVFVESNYFRNCPKPMLIANQGSDTGTFGEENGGMIKAYGNYIEGAKNYVPYSQNSSAFDCYDVTDRNATVPADVVAVTGGAGYNNFDTAADFYKYTADAAADVPAIVEANAGRVNGGDFKWTFNDEEDDASYDVNTALQTACLNYTSSLVSIGGVGNTSTKVYYTVIFDPNNGIESTSKVSVEKGQKVTQPADPTVPDGYESFSGWYNGTTKFNFDSAVNSNLTLTAKYAVSVGSGDGDDVTGEVILHDFTKDGLTSSYFTITGSLKDAQLTSATYNNTVFTGKPLKMESSTSITFTTATTSTLVLVFEEGITKRTKVDGDNYTAENGVITVENLAAGDHSITKGDSVNLFAIYVIPEGASLDPGPTPAPVTEYTITVDLADGSATTSFKVTAGNAITTTELPAPTREGYTFIGWVDSENNTINLPYTPTGDMTITATWQQNTGADDGGDDNPGTGGGGEVDPGTGDGGDGDPGTGDGGDKNPVKEKGLKVRLANPGEKYVYTGSAIKPAIIVTNNGEELIAGVDYTVKYSNNVKASIKNDATITVKGKGNLTGSKSTTFKIEPKDIGESDVIEGSVVVVKGKKATPILTYNNKKLSSKDYNNPDAKKKFEEDGVITITGKGNFTGERKINVKVVEKLKKFNVIVGPEELTYDGKEQKPTITVVDKESESELEDDDYRIVYGSSTVNAGTVKFTVIGKGMYTGTVSKSYKIKPRAVKEDGLMDVTLANSSGYGYSSKGVTIGEDLTVTYKPTGEVLTEGKDYKITYSNNKKISTEKSPARYTIRFLGNYKGSKALKGEFTIKPISLSDDIAGLKIVVGDKIYTGSPNVYKSVPLVSIDGVTLKASNYTVTYYKDAGFNDQITSRNKLELAENETSKTIYVKIVGKGNYKSANGEYATAEYKVCRKPEKSEYNLSKARVTFWDDGEKITKKEYTGREITPTVKVEVKIDGEWTGVKSDNYEVSYVNNVNKGTASVVVTATGGEYVGSKTAKFKIVAMNLRTISDLLKELFGI